MPECQDTVLMEEAGLNIYISFIIEKKKRIGSEEGETVL